MKNEAQVQPKAISTPTIIVLVVGLGLLGYLLLQPLFAPKEQAAAPSSPAEAAAQPATSSTGAASAPVPASTGTTAASDQTDLTGDGFLGTAHRDPFLPSTIMLAKPEPQPVRAEPVAKLEPPQPVDKLPAPPQEVPLSWKGVVGSGPNQVVMIQRNNRTYTLHLGDVVAGTEYILAEVSKDSILLISPQGQKRLFKKKEVK
jgi:cytoskeletal protein RodZ